MGWDLVAFKPGDYDREAGRFVVPGPGSREDPWYGKDDDSLHPIWKLWRDDDVYELDLEDGEAPGAADPELAGAVWSPRVHGWVRPFPEDMSIMLYSLQSSADALEVAARFRRLPRAAPDALEMALWLEHWARKGAEFRLST